MKVNEASASWLLQHYNIPSLSDVLVAVLDTKDSKLDLDNSNQITTIIKYDIDNPIILILRYRKLTIIG